MTTLLQFLSYFARKLPQNLVFKYNTLQKKETYVKKYILLLLFLTAIVVGPFVYQRWNEAKRLRHIRETKQHAAQIRATPLKDFLQQLDQTSPEQTVLVLFTGNTQAHLEPCGCFI